MSHFVSYLKREKELLALLKTIYTSWFESNGPAERRIMTDVRDIELKIMLLLGLAEAAAMESALLNPSKHALVQHYVGQAQGWINTLDTHHLYCQDTAIKVNITLVKIDLWLSVAERLSAMQPDEAQCTTRAQAEYARCLS